MALFAVAGNPDFPALQPPFPKSDTPVTGQMRYCGRRDTPDTPARLPAACSKSDRLELLDDERFGKSCAGPLLERRQRHHRLEIMPRFAAHLDRIGAEAMHHRRKH